MTEKDDKQDGYISDIINAFKLPKEAFEPAYPSSWYVQQELNLRPDNLYSTQYITNITVSSKFGHDIDAYLRKTYLEYNHRTEVVIIAGANRRNVQYTYFVADKDDQRLVDRVRHSRVEFQQIMTNSGTMLLAYAPEINTLFVRTLFDVIRTPDNPDDRMDIEARLGL